MSGVSAEVTIEDKNGALVEPTQEAEPAGDAHKEQQLDFGA